MQPLDLISTARRLVGKGRGKPRQADLKRALSTTYYALFHALCRNCADCFVGRTSGSRDEKAWEQAYRAVEHGFVRNQFRNKLIRDSFPEEIQDLASIFVELQRKRHQADYVPSYRLTRSEVLIEIDASEMAIKKLRQASMKDLRSLAIWTVMKKRLE
ncbi:MAG: hypothetical protein OXC82_02555 [Rhodobacteraceae bacterium]|nr:hypothetical protein [Paracoccaceae bacterium]MCY4249304.1 hypothetical protein [Paracoccaceae bacterium]